MDLQHQMERGSYNTLDETENGTETYVCRVQVTPVVHIPPPLLLDLSLPVTVLSRGFRTHGGFHPHLLEPSGHSRMRTQNPKGKQHGGPERGQ